MRALGIVVQKNHLRFVVLEGSMDSPTIVASSRQNTSDPDDVTSLMDWFETHFGHLIDNYEPDVICYKLNLEPKSIEQIHTLSFPLAILNLIAHKKGIKIIECSQRGITPAKLSLPKSTDLHQHVDDVLGQHPPYWDKYQREAALVGWFCL